MFEWLGMVHKIPRVGEVKRALERLKMKSLLERLGDGFEKWIGMHDLWRAFCIAEPKSGELRLRRLMYEAVNCSDRVETSLSGTCWENVKRMVFLDIGEWRSLEEVNFAHFSNVTVLKISGFRMSRKVVVDLSGLIHLKSLDVIGKDLNNLDIQGLPRDLSFLTYISTHPISQLRCSEQLVKQIACLEELQCLHLVHYGDGKLPDMRSMISLRVAIFSERNNVVTLSGLSSKLINLRVLNLRRCVQLRSYPSLDDLVFLEELNCNSCRRLKKLPNLRKLRNLRRLNISGSELFSELPGLGDLVALEELYAGLWWYQSKTSFKLPDMSKLRKLRVLRLDHRLLEGVWGFDSEYSLQNVCADFRALVNWPNLRQLTKLQELRIRGWSLAGLRGLDDLAMLHTLHVGDCKGVDELPDVQGLISLQRMSMKNCESKDVSSLSNFSTLLSVRTNGCRKMERLPSLQRLPKLKSLEVMDCNMLRGWDFTAGQVADSLCRPDDSNIQFVSLDSQRLTGLRRVRIMNCMNFAQMTSIGACSQLQILVIGYTLVRELPSMSNFPLLKALRIRKCDLLTRLTTIEPMTALTELSVNSCSSLVTLPDLGNFPGLFELKLTEYNGLTKLSTSEPLPALQVLKLDDCSGVKSLPDLGMFPALKNLRLNGCSELVTLSSSGPLIAFKGPDARGCRNLSQDDLDQLQAWCPQCQIDHGPLCEDSEWSQLSQLFMGWFGR